MKDSAVRTRSVRDVQFHLVSRAGLTNLEVDCGLCVRYSVCVCVCVRACVRACVCVCACVCV